MNCVVEVPDNIIVHSSPITILFLWIRDERLIGFISLSFSISNSYLSFDSSLMLL